MKTESKAKPKVDSMAGSVCDHQWDYEPKGFCSGVKTRTCKVCGAVEKATTPY